MELENKYLKYDSSITEPLFNKLIEKINLLGCNKQSDNQNDYEGFCKFKLIQFSGKYWDTRGDTPSQSEECGFTEITISEILAEDCVMGTLQYDSSITQEVFNDIIKVLKSQGMVAEGTHSNLEGFKHYGGLAINGITWQTVVYNHHYTRNQILLSDILKSEPLKLEPSYAIFPFKVGDTIRCDKLNTWSGKQCSNYPVSICKGKEVIIEEIGASTSEYTPFKANYQGVSYGFAYASSNSYSLVHKLGKVQSIVSIQFDKPIIEPVTRPIMIIVPKI